MLSLYEHSTAVISIGPEILAEYRRQDYAFSAIELAVSFAREKGYKIVSQQVRTDNAASIGLHLKLEFETDGYVYKNRHGNDILIFLKYIV